MDLSYLKKLYNQKNYWELNNQIMTDTEELCDTHPALIYAIDNTIASSFVVYQEDILDVNPKPWKTKIIVSNKRSFEAAKEYRWKKIAVLNFANNHSPWWAPHRSWAQEESLCRCSTLYPCLIWWDNYNKFYQRHIDQFSHKEIDAFWNDDILYLPDIIVFKSDEDIPLTIDEGYWYNVDVIVSAAPELHYGDPYKYDRLEKALKSRIKRILDVAYKQKIEVLILWAYWCWAFHNPPVLVAKIFKELLKNYDFEIVEFPVFYRDDIWSENYEVFNNTFNHNSNDKYNLKRFKEAHKRHYNAALEEIRNWRKESHWMWYIFPQIAWLGYSQQSLKYSISWIEEAKAYLEDEELRKNLLEITQTFLELKEDNPENILWYIDALKLRSCMTLFKQADPEIELFEMVLNKFYNWEQDSMTLEILWWISEEEYPTRIESEWPKEYEWENKEEFEDISKKREELLKKLSK